MAWWEAHRIVNGIRRSERNSWMTMRTHAFLILSAMGAKVSSAQELIPLPWEKTEAAPKEVTEEEYQKALDLIREANNSKPEA